jgi:hypothetical protein
MTGTTLNNFRVSVFLNDMHIRLCLLSSTIYQSVPFPCLRSSFLNASLHRYHVSYWRALQKLIVAHLIKELLTVFLDSLSLEYRADSLSKIVGNYQSTLRNILVEKMSQDGRLTGLVTSCLALPSKTRYWRKYIRKDRSDVKRRNKTLSAIG